MNALAERQMLPGVLAVDVEGVELVELLLVAVREARSKRSLASSGTSTPEISTGRVAMRRQAGTEVSNLSISSTAFSIRSGSSRNSFHTSRRVESCRSPLAMRLVVSCLAKVRL